jgi:hypothetical protein
MTTAIKPLLLLHALLVCGQAIGASAATLETLLRTIAEGEGRAVYEAFKGIPEVANTTEKQERAFEGLSIYLGQTNKDCVVPDYYRPETRVTERSFSYAYLAGESIRNLGEPGRRGLVKFLTSKPKPVAEQAALILCGIGESAILSKSRPQLKNFPPLDAGERKALEAFLQKWGDSFPVYTLTRFYRAGFPAAAGYMHAILKATRDPGEKHSAAIYLGSYGYAPALDDLLKIFKETPDASLRGTVRESFQYFTDSDRVIRALTKIMENAKDEGLRKDCQTALERVGLKAEWRRKYGTRMTNDSPHVPRTNSNLDKQ